MALSTKDETKPDTKAPTYKVESKDDHVGHIAELARGLFNGVSPSGAETIGTKIMEHVGAIQDPKSHDERKVNEFKAEQDIEAQRAKERVELKTNPTDEDKAKAAKANA